MDVKGALTSSVKWLKWLGALLLGVAVAVVVRAFPKGGSSSTVTAPPPPDMTKADENVKDLEQQQVVIKDQHTQIEQTLAPKPVTPDKSLDDAVRNWNEDK